MTSARAGFAVLGLTCALASGCARLRRVAVDDPQRPPHDLAVLLPDSDGTVGRATVSNVSGATDLSEARAATRVSRNQAPSAATVLTEADVQREFGDALSALPPAPQTFTLHFQFESENLTPESRALVTATLQAVKQRPVPDVLVVGHTDTTGAAALNFQLALRRAQAVRALLVAAGLDESAVAVASHGEAQPLVPDTGRHLRSAEPPRAHHGAMTGRSRRTMVCVGALPMLLVGMLCLLRPAFLTSLERSVYDTLARAADHRSPGGRVVIVDVDERSLSALGQWPWRRDFVRPARLEPPQPRRIGHRARHHVPGAGSIQRSQRSVPTPPWRRR